MIAESLKRAKAALDRMDVHGYSTAVTLDGGTLETLVSGVERLQARVQELEKDRKRLEWVVNNEASIDIENDVTWSVHWKGGGPRDQPVRTYFCEVVTEDWREAIDAAMQKEAE